MSACERAIEVEDLILGLGAPDDLEAHVETCADCKDAKDMFLAERELFAARPVVPAPRLKAMPSRVIPFRAYAPRVIPALAGLAAAVAALAVGHPFGAPKIECETSTPTAIAPAIDEPLTCESRGFSAPAPAMTLASHTPERLRERGDVCVASDRATCDLPESMSVTSSLATP